MSWELQIKRSARKSLSQFPKKDQLFIEASLEKILSDPYSGDLRKMKGEENAWRRRIGSYRIFYEVLLEEKVIYVFRIERRTSKTY